MTSTYEWQGLIAEAKERLAEGIAETVEEAVDQLIDESLTTEHNREALTIELRLRGLG